MKQVNNYRHKALCIETENFIVNLGRTNGENKLLPPSSYKKEFAKANSELGSQLSLEFGVEIPRIVDCKKYAEVTYGYKYGDMTHLKILLPSGDYKSVEYSENLLKNIRVYENYVPKELVEESIVSLKESLNKEAEKIV